MNWGTLLWGLFTWAVVVTPGHAITWQDLWATRDQQAQKFWHAGDYSQAEHVFQRPDWRATAAYRAGHYQQAAQGYQSLQTADGYYNAGNAWAKMGQYQAAINAYDHALQIEPHHQDALFNRDIVKKLLEKQSQQSSSKPQQSPSSDAKKPDSSEKQQPSPTSQDKSASKSPKPEPQTPQKDQKGAQEKSKATKPPPQPDKQKPSEQADPATQKQPADATEHEAQQAKEQWLRLIPDDPAYLLREKFLRDHLQRQQEEGAP